MTVLARTRLGATKLARHRTAAPSTGAAPSPNLSVLARRRREAGAPQDQAVYTCQCGFVFQAPVSTSVGCPHCGDTQAW